MAGGRPKTGVKQVLVGLEPEQLEVLDRLGGGRSRSDVIREAVAEWVARHDGSAPAPVVPAPAASGYVGPAVPARPVPRRSALPEEMLAVLDRTLPKAPAVLKEHVDFRPMLDVLAAGGKSERDLAKALGWEMMRVQRRVREMEAHGLVSVAFGLVEAK